jgi:hypothetical protein
VTLSEAQEEKIFRLAGGRVKELQVQLHEHINAVEVEDIEEDVIMAPPSAQPAPKAEPAPAEPAPAEPAPAEPAPAEPAPAEPAPAKETSDNSP